LNLKLKNGKVVELPDLGRTVVTYSNVASGRVRTCVGRYCGGELVWVDAFECELQRRSDVCEQNGIRRVGEVLASRLHVCVQVTEGAVEGRTLLNEIGIVLIGHKHAHSRVPGSYHVDAHRLAKPTRKQHN
jgi:hypothetical protein